MEQNKRRIPPPPPRPFPPQGKTEIQKTSTGTDHTAKDSLTHAKNIHDDRKLESVEIKQSNMDPARTDGSKTVDNEKGDTKTMQQSPAQASLNQKIEDNEAEKKSEVQSSVTVGEGIGAMSPQEDLLVKKAPEKQKGISRKIQIPLYILGSVICFALAGVCIFLLLR